MEQDLITQIWPQVIWPILRITFFITVGLFIANMIESLNWTHRLATLARPLIKVGRLSSITGASFSVAFFSGVSANSMLAEAFDQKKMGIDELIFANLFNSLPRFFLHLPTVFFLTAPLIKGAAFIYVGLTFSAALLQTCLVVLGGRLFLPIKTYEEQPSIQARKKTSWKQAFEKSVKRLRKRIIKILKFMIPVYTLFFLLNRFGFFTQLEDFIANRAWFLSWLNPQSLGIVILHISAEFSAGLAAASVLLAENSLSYRDVVLALLAGNILAAPIRALRHQLPYYTGIFSPRLAVILVGVSQSVRAFCVILIAICYYYFTL